VPLARPAELWKNLWKLVFQVHASKSGLERDAVDKQERAWLSRPVLLHFATHLVMYLLRLMQY
jgi:hypothetical protein